MIMGHSKHKLSRKKKHVVLPKTNCHTTPLVFPITATTSPQWPLSSVAKVAVNVERFNCTLNFLENHAADIKIVENASGLSYIKTFLPDQKG